MENKEMIPIQSNGYVAYAKAMNVRIAPKKLVVISKYLRGMSLPKALQVIKMHAMIKKAFRLIENVALSARANLAVMTAKKGEEFKEENYIFDIQTSRGSANRHSYLPRGKGSADTITKYSSHITVGLKEVKNGKTD